MSDILNFIIIVLALPTFFLMLRVLFEIRNAPPDPAPYWEQLEHQDRRRRRNQARFTEQSHRQRVINQAKWDRKIEQSEQRAKQRQNERWGWNDGWEWDK